ncbi:MAG: hypothetical protein U0805_20915 [Pirellulales bacterium]
MSTATKEQSKLGDQAIADQAVIEQQAIFESAEAILWNLDPQSRPNSREMAVLRQAGIVDSVQLDAERGRVAAVKDLLVAAGSPEEFEQASRAAIAAAKAQQEKAPALEKQLAELQAQLGQLSGDRDRTSRALGRFTSARERLRGLSVLPAFVREAYEADLAALRSSALGRRISELKTTIGIIDNLQTIAPSSREALLHCETAKPELLQRRTTCNPQSQNQVTNVKFDELGFVQYRERRLKVEKPQLERELAQLSDEYSHELRRIEGQLDFYIDQI